MKRVLYLLLFLSSITVQGQFSAGVAGYAADNTPAFAVLEGNTFSTPDKASVVKDSLRCGIIRTQIVTTNWNGSLVGYETFRAYGLRQWVNISYYPTSGGAHPFISGTLLNNFFDTLTLILNAYPDIYGVCLLNEEQNPGYNSGSLATYGAWALRLHDTLHRRGIILSNGGFTGAGTLIKTYRWLVVKQGQAVADAFGLSCMTIGQINAAKNKNSNPTLEYASNQIDTLISYKAAFDSYIFHEYEPMNARSTQLDTFTTITANAFMYIRDYIENATQKPCDINEYGHQKNSQPTLTTGMLKELYRLGFRRSAIWDGVAATNDARPLIDVSNKAVLPTGRAFVNYFHPNTY